VSLPGGAGHAPTRLEWCASKSPLENERNSLQKYYPKTKIKTTMRNSAQPKTTNTQQKLNKTGQQKGVVNIY
jgi:hypothetical protein